MQITKNAINKVRVHIPKLCSDLSDDDIRRAIERVGMRNAIQEIKTLQKA